MTDSVLMTALRKRAQSHDANARRWREELPAKRKERARLRRLSQAWDKPSAAYWNKPKGSKAWKKAKARHRESLRAANELKFMQSERDLERAIVYAEERFAFTCAAIRALEHGTLDDFEDRDGLRELIVSIIDGLRADVGMRTTEIKLGRMLGGSGRDDGRIRRAKQEHAAMVACAQPILDQLSEGGTP